MQGTRSTGLKRHFWKTIISWLLCYLVSYTTGMTEWEFEAQILPLNSTEDGGDYISTTNVEKLDNFNQALQPFANSGCLLHITSFQTQTQLDNLYIHPVILRRLNLYKLNANSTFPNSGVNFGVEKHAWVMTGTNPPIRYSSSFPNCPRSKYFHLGKANLYDPGSYCSQLKYNDFSSNSKPWTCEVLISLFPPLSPILTREQKERRIELGASYEAGYPDNWQFYYTEDSNHFPSSTPTYTILVARGEFHRQIAKMDLATKSWISTFLAKYALSDHSARENSKPTVAAFIFQTEVKHVSQEHISLRESIKMIYLLKICLHCVELSKFISINQHWSMREWELHSVTSLVASLEKHETNENLLLWIVENIQGEIMFNLKCLTDYFREGEKKNKWILEASHPVELATRAVAHVWFEIIGNFTYIPTPHTSCKISWSTNPYNLQKRAIQLVIQQFHIINDTKYFPVYIQNEIFTLRFISCGRPRMSTLAFLEFTNVFDEWIWIFIFVTPIFIILLKKVIQKLSKTNIGNSEKNFMEFLDTFKLLLDKGDFEVLDKPFCATWRIPFGLFMLTMIVISNAYRNNNVYNMVKPIESIPYDYFDELIRDGFKIYARGGIFVRNLLKGENTSWDLTLTSSNDHEWLGHGRDIFLDFRSDLSMMLDSWMNFIYKTGKLGTANKLHYIMNHSKLHPDSTAAANKTILSEHYSPNPEVIEKVLRKGQLDLLEQSVKKCDGLALFMPQHECTSIEYKWRNVKNMHVGKERMFESIMGFNIRGALPLPVWNRIKVMNFAGVWLRWRELSQHGANLKRASPNRHASGVVEPTMQGNTLVIFAIFLGGLGLAIAIFIVECFKLIHESCSSALCSCDCFLATKSHSATTRKLLERRKFCEQYPLIYLNELRIGNSELQEPIFVKVRPPQV